MIRQPMFAYHFPSGHLFDILQAGWSHPYHDHTMSCTQRCICSLVPRGTGPPASDLLCMLFKLLLPLASVPRLVLMSAVLPSRLWRHYFTLEKGQPPLKPLPWTPQATS